MYLYHGSKKIVKKPQYGIGSIFNDYGRAFYCTEEEKMAAEWSASENEDGFVNKYSFDPEGLKELNLDSGEYNVLNWLAVLLENRTFRLNSDLMKVGKQYILEEFLPDYRQYDYIRGYRADDSYFSFAGAFLSNSISLEQLQKALFLGKMGEQIAIVSEKAFGKLEFVEAKCTDHTIYFPLKENRDRRAREAFAREKGNPLEGVYLLEIIKEKWVNEDERLQRIVFK